MVGVSEDEVLVEDGAPGVAAVQIAFQETCLEWRRYRDASIRESNRFSRRSYRVIVDVTAEQLHVPCIAEAAGLVQWRSILAWAMVALE